MTEAEQVMAADGPLDYGLAARVLQEVGSQEQGRQGRYRSFKHPGHPGVVTLREWPPGVCQRKYVKKLQSHIRMVLSAPENEEEDATNESDN